MLYSSASSVSRVSSPSVQAGTSVRMRASRHLSWLTVGKLLHPTRCITASPHGRLRLLSLNRRRQFDPLCPTTRKRLQATSSRVICAPHVGAHHEAERAPGAGGQAEREQAHERLVQRNVRQGGRAKQHLSCLQPPSTRNCSMPHSVSSISIAGQIGVQRLCQFQDCVSMHLHKLLVPSLTRYVWLAHSTNDGSASTGC